MSFLRIFSASLLVLLGAGTASGRQASLTGSLSLLQEYDSNIDLSETNEEGGWYTTLSPSIVLTSEAEHDRLSFGYAPGLRYNHNDDETEVDHYLTLEGSKQFSRRLSAELKENYLRSNDYTYYIEEYVRQEGAGIPLAADRARNQYWTNGIGLSADYEYAKNSVLGLGYANQILNNDLPSYDDYVKHHPYVSVAHQLNTEWEAEVSYDYIKGDFDSSEDFGEHVFGGLANYLWSRHDLLFGSYQYATLDYDGLRSGYDLHRGDVGWQRELGPHSALATSVGFSFVDQDRGDNETAFNYAVDYTRTIKRGDIAVGGRGGMDELQFDAATEDGLSRFWSLRADANYRLTEPLTSQAFFSYREDTFLEAIPEYDEESFILGMSLTYAFQQWYALTLGYSYRQLDSERPLNDYDDYRFYVQLSMGKELKRWL